MKYLVLISLMSCVATMVKSPGKTSKYAPKGYQEIGVVEYSNAGAGHVVAARKEDAFKKMCEACDGNYTIVREGNKAQFNTITAHEQDTWMIEFSCSSVVSK